jgi:hypothetical protein
LASLYLQIFEPGKTVIAFKENVSEISFIIKGDVIVFDKQSSIEIVKFSEDSYFGDV